MKHADIKEEQIQNLRKVKIYSIQTLRKWFQIMNQVQYDCAKHNSIYFMTYIYIHHFTHEFKDTYNKYTIINQGYSGTLEIFCFDSTCFV